MIAFTPVPVPVWALATKLDCQNFAHLFKHGHLRAPRILTYYSVAPHDMIETFVQSLDLKVGTKSWVLARDCALAVIVLGGLEIERLLQGGAFPGEKLAAPFPNGLRELLTVDANLTEPAHHDELTLAQTASK